MKYLSMFGKCSQIRFLNPNKRNSKPNKEKTQPKNESLKNVYSHVHTNFYSILIAISDSLSRSSSRAKSIIRVRTIRSSTSLSYHRVHLEV